MLCAMLRGECKGKNRSGAWHFHRDSSGSSMHVEGRSASEGE